MAKAYFDFDDTLILGDTLLYFRSEIFRINPKLRLFLPLNWFLSLLTGIGLIKVSTLKLTMLWPFAFLNSTQQKVLLERFFEEVCIPRLYPEVLDLLKGHIQSGHEVIITSASWDAYLSAGWKKLFPEIKVLGSQIHFQGKWRVPAYFGWGNNKKENKIRALSLTGCLPKQNELIYSYSDSTADLPLLNLAQKVVLINPNSGLKNLMNQSEAELTILKTNRPAKGRIVFGKCLLFLTGKGLRFLTLPRSFG